MFTALLSACGVFDPQHPGGPRETCVVEEGRTFSRDTELRELEGCRAVTGNLSITSAPEVTDLSPLAGLEEVSGNLELNQTGVTHLDALGRLRSVGGELRIDFNPQLTRVNGLGALESVGGDVLLADNEALESVEGWAAYSAVSQGFTVARNKNLKRVGVFVGLQKIKALTISDNPNLLDVDVDAGRVKSLASLTISRNARLITVRGLGGVSRVGSAEYSNNPRLSRLEIMTNLRYAENMVLKDLPYLTNIIALLYLWEVEDKLILSGLGVENFYYLYSIRRVGGRLEIRDNLSLTEFATFHNVGISSGLADVANDGIFVTGNPVLRAFYGFNYITKLKGPLRIENNASLQSLSGLDRLTQVGALAISGCPTLERLTGLEALRSPGTDLQVHSNARLPACEADKLWQQLRARGFQGTPTLHDNLGTGTCP